MNRNQKLVLVVAGVIIVIMLVFPPFQHVIPGRGTVSDVDYGFLFAPPHWATVSVGLLFAQWVVVAVLGGIAWVLLSGDKSPKPRTDSRLDRETRPYILTGRIGIGLLSFIRAVLFVVAISQIFGLIPIWSWFSYMDSVTAGMWQMAGVKVIFLVLSILLFLALGRINEKLRRRIKGSNESSEKGSMA